MYPGGVASKLPWDVQANVAGIHRHGQHDGGNNVDDARVWRRDSPRGANYGSPALVRDYERDP